MFIDINVQSLGIKPIDMARAHSEKQAFYILILHYAAIFNVAYLDSLVNISTLSFKTNEILLIGMKNWPAKQGVYFAGFFY